MPHGHVGEEDGVGHDKLEEAGTAEDDVAHVVVGQGVAAAG